MTKEEVLKDIRSLTEVIDKCTTEFTDGSLIKWDELDINHVRMLNLLVEAHQELSFLYDYIKEGGKDE